MICLLTKLSQCTDVVPWLICVVDLIYRIHHLWKDLGVWRWCLMWMLKLIFASVCYAERFIIQASSAYWRGNKDRESLQRVYGISYPDKKRLKVGFCFWLLVDTFVLPVVTPLLLLGVKLTHSTLIYGCFGLLGVLACLGRCCTYLGGRYFPN